MTDNRKITFILCTNDPVRCRECVSYIGRLSVPDGFSVHILTIENASGICCAYNRGMEESGAGYKVYLHQDTFIINRSFLPDMISCFERHPKAGMIGMIGRKNFANRERFYQNELFGALYETRTDRTVRYYNYSRKDDERVLHLDGLLLMTCTDIPWREDLFDGWHLYDVSQSLEMIRAGYELYVPYMENPWALHDCGVLSVRDYAVYRDRAAEEYKEFFTADGMTLKNEELSDTDNGTAGTKNE